MEITVKVALRYRPLSNQDASRGCQSIVESEGSVVTVKAVDDSLDTKRYTFDHVFDQNESNASIFENIGKPTVSIVLDGFSYTIFAYGEPNTGKTHTMFGTKNEPGLISQINEELWNRLEKENLADNVLVSFSFFEIDKEHVKDLLNPSDQTLQIEETPEGIHVKDLTELVSITKIYKNHRLHFILTAILLIGGEKSW